MAIQVFSRLGFSECPPFTRDRGFPEAVSEDAGRHISTDRGIRVRSLCQPRDTVIAAQMNADAIPFRETASLCLAKIQVIAEQIKADKEFS